MVARKLAMYSDVSPGHTHTEWLSGLTLYKFNSLMLVLSSLCNFSSDLACCSLTWTGRLFVSRCTAVSVTQESNGAVTHLFQFADQVLGLLLKVLIGGFQTGQLVLYSVTLHKIYTHMTEIQCSVLIQKDRAVRLERFTMTIPHLLCCSGCIWALESRYSSPVTEKEAPHF